MNLFTTCTVKITRQHAIKTRRSVEVQLCPFLTATLDRVGGQRHGLAALPP